MGLVSRRNEKNVLALPVALLRLSVRANRGRSCM